jgi:quercetin dioxygenase-like cupin family protein
MQTEQQEAVAGAVLIRPNQRKRRSFSGTQGIYEELTPATARSMVVFDMKLEPGDSTRRDLKHGGDECCVLLEGTDFLVEIDGQKLTMQQGDSLFIPRGTRHVATNAGTVTAHAIFVLCPPDY